MAETPNAGYSKRWVKDVHRIMEVHKKRWGAMLADDITPVEIQIS